MNSLFSFFQTFFSTPLLAYAFFNFLLLFIFIYLCRSYIFDILKSIPLKIYLVLFVILLIEILINSFFVDPKHVLFVDEFWYMKAAKNILILGDAQGYPKAIGWPFLISIGFLFFGMDNYVAIFLSMTLGMLVFINIFLITLMISKNRFVAVISSAIFAFIPINIFWFATSETRAASLFFVTLSLFFSLLYYKHKKNTLLWLALLGWAFSAQIRLENILYLALFASGILLFLKPNFKFRFSFFIPWVVALNFISINFIRVVKWRSGVNWLEEESHGLLKGSAVSIDNLIDNSLTWAPKLIDGSLSPIIFTVFAVVGVFYLIKYMRRYALFLATWFIFMYIAYFSIWFQVYGASFSLLPKTGLFLFFYPVLAIFCAFGLCAVFLIYRKRFLRHLSVILSVVVLAFFIPYYKNYPLKDDAQSLETEVVSSIRRDIPGECIIVANLSDVVNSVNFHSAVGSELFLQNKDTREYILSSSDCVLFFEDFTSIASYGFKETKARLKVDFLLTPFKKYTKGDYSYTFYNIEKPLLQDKIK